MNLGLCRVPTSGPKTIQGFDMFWPTFRDSMHICMNVCRYACMHVCMYWYVLVRLGM